MTPFHEVVNRIRWTPGEDPAAYVVVFVDRLEGDARDLQELPLPDFLESDVPEHRVRALRRGAEVVWARPAGARVEPGPSG